MATTTLVDSTFSADLIGARTDNAGTAVVDTTAEEARLLSSILTSGYLSPAAAFQVTAQASPNMTVRVGSLTTKTDYYVLTGTVAGQGNYIVRLDVASQNVTITAADASQTRTDEIYLVVQDNAYDTSARALPRIGYRAGTLGGANPGPDGTWTAYALLARITVAATVTSIVNANISNQRTAAGIATALLPASISPSLLTTKGDLLAASGTSTPVRVGVGTTNQVLTPNSGATPGVAWADPQFQLIQSVLVGSLVGSVTFGSIPQNYNNLKIVMRGAGDSSFQQIYAQINGDTSAHYDTQYVSFTGTASNIGSQLSSNGMQLGIIGYNNPSTCECIVTDYSSGGLGGTHLFNCQAAFQTATGPLTTWLASSRNWANTNAITSMVLFPASGNFNVGMRISLYGMS